MGLKSLDLSGLRALVTGAGTGLGRQMSLGLAEAGADLILCGRRREPLEECSEAVAMRGVSVTVVTADITSLSDSADLRAAAGRVDVLVNNAGISPLHDWRTVTVEEWRHVMQVNLEAPFRLAQMFAPEMAERKWGRIINVCSVYANLAGNPAMYPGVAWDIPAYVPSKHGLHGVTRYLAVRLAKDGVCVNSLSPGMFLTEGTRQKLNPDTQTTLASATPVGRLGQEDDLQAAVVFLASPGAKFVTGQNLTVDGGWSVW